MNCPACGNEVDAQSVYCPKCGQRLDAAVAQQPLAGEQPATAAAAFRQAVPGRRLGADDVEADLWSGRYSSRDMMGVWIICGIATLVLLGLAGWAAATMDWAPAVIWGGLLVVLLVMWGYPLSLYAYRRISFRYRLTTQRFFHERGILRHVTDRIEVIDMDDVTYEQTIVQRMFNVGTLHIQSSDRTHPELTLHGIEDVGKVASLMDDARRTERMRRGLHIEAV